MRPALRAARAALAALAFAAACGGESLTDPTPIVGTYTLQTVNGQTPPRLLDDVAGSRTEITGGRISLNTDGIVHQEADLRTTSAVGSTTGGTIHIFGTYVRRGNRILVSWRDGSAGRMTLAAATLTQDYAGLTLVYGR